MKMINADVAVVGAGPGGAMLSYLLARSGVQTVLVEQHSTLDREFRGYFLQPQVLRFLDEVGLLHDVLSLPHEKVDAFHFVDHGKELFAVRFDELDRPYNFGINIPQPPFLQLMIDLASQYPNFTFVNGTSVKDLVYTDGRVAGVRGKAAASGEEVEIRTRAVVGADGRYSRVRKLAGIEAKGEPFPLDFVWFDMPALEGVSYPGQISVTDAGYLIYVPMGRSLQIGWVIPKGSYSEVRKQGIEPLRDQIIAADPGLKAWLTEHLTDFKQCSLLSIEVNLAEKWARDGLLLIGDAAHTASPFSGQGNSMAITDAVVAHQAIMEGLTGGEGILPEQILNRVAEIRIPAVREIMRIQNFQAKMLNVKHPMAVWARQLLMPVVRRTPFFRRMRDKIALGVRAPRVAVSYFRS